MKRLLCILCAMLLWCPAAEAAREVPKSRQEMQLSFAPLVKRVTPAVVNIYTKRKVQVTLSPFMADPMFQRFFGNQFGFGGMNKERVVSSLGSGVIIDPRGVVVTSHHVIENSEDIVVVLSDRREFSAEVILADPSSDLAFLVLDIDKDALLEDEVLPHLAPVDSDLVEVGDLVLAVGNPFGVGQTVTSGIVSALSRSAQGVSDFNFFIQTDAAINPGNSGGALVDMNGDLIGVNTAIYTRSGGSNGIGFAIPSNMIRALLRNMQGDGTVLRPWLGASYQDMTSEIAESLGIKRPRGVLIASIFKDSPAQRGGLQVGDIILEMNETRVDDVASLKFRVATVSTKEFTKFQILREGALIERQVKLDIPPEKPERDARTLEGSHPLGGITVANLSPRVALELGMAPDKTGVVVMQATPGNTRTRFGLQKGDIVESVNGRAITSTQQLEAIMQDRLYGWNIVIRRGNKRLGIRVER